MLTIIQAVQDGFGHHAVDVPRPDLRIAIMVSFGKDMAK